MWGQIASAILPVIGGSLLNKFTQSKNPISVPFGQSNFLNPTQLLQQNQKNSFLGKTGLGSVFSMFTNPAAQIGTGLLGLGLSSKNPKVPALPQSVNDLRGQIQAGGSPLGQLAQSKLTQQLNQQYQPLSQPEIDAALRQLERDQGIEEDKVRDLYRNLRPGSDPSTDSAFQRDLAQVSDQFSRAKADTVATRTRDTQAIFNQQQAQAIQQSLGASDSQMSQLAQIANLDVQQIMTKLQMDYASALYFKQVFANLGGQLISQGMSNGDPLTALLSRFSV